ncbi:hypothetical protein H4R35_003540 [Dimargaris xerosporica]|nr:hypothetical protein H4R35_003540 [Dimargaris xerosporica]
MSEVEETIQRLVAKKGVKGVIVVTNEGAIIKSTIEEELSAKYAKLMARLVDTTRDTVHQLDSQNDLAFLRVRTKKHEIMLSPDPNYLLIVVQNPQEHT